MSATARLRVTLEDLLHGRELDRRSAETSFEALADPDVPNTLKGAFLTALRAKGETARELADFARAMLARATGPIACASPVLVDTCGTGGDGSNSFNLSTAAALVLAAAGVPVAKHGNRSISSRSGSADLIEALGIPFATTPRAASEKLAAHGFAFLFAPAFHTATAGVVTARRELGIRTLFNVLGPLVNPARPTHQLTGTGEAQTAERMAHALSRLDLQRAFVVRGTGGWDEATPVGPFTLLDVRDGRVEAQSVEPRDFGVDRCGAEDLAGGDAAENARLLAEIFAGATGPLRDAVLLNAALVLLLVERAQEPREAFRLAAAAIDDGRAQGLVERLASPGHACIPDTEAGRTGL